MKYCLIIFLASVSGLVHAQTLNDYLEEAATNNLILRAKFNEYQAALERIPQVKALPDPEVSFGYFISPVETRVGAQEARISAMQMFPWMGTLGAKKDVATELSKAKYEAFEAQKEQLYLDVKKAYLSLYKIEQSIELTQRHIEILETYERLATRKFENGNGSMVDVLRVQMEMDELANNLLLLQDKRRPLMASFNRLLNRKEDTLVNIPDTLVGWDLETKVNALSDSITLENHKKKVMTYELVTAELAQKVAKKEGYPSFGLGLNYIIVSKRDEMPMPGNGQDAFMPMLTIKLPIYRGKYSAKKKEAEYMTRVKQDQLFDYIAELEVALAKHRVAYDDADRRITLYQNQNKKAEQALSILAEAYATGGKDFEEILRLQRMILVNDLKLIEAITDKNTAIAEIEAMY